MICCNFGMIWFTRVDVCILSESVTKNFIYGAI